MRWWIMEPDEIGKIIDEVIAIFHKFVTLNPHSKSDNGIIICSDELRALLLKYKDLKNDRDESKIS